MKKIFISISLIFLFTFSIFGQQTTAFSYQGKLNNSATAANGTYDFKFELYNVVLSGAPIGTVSANGVSVINGVFTVQLDFGANAFDGTDRFLDIAVRLPASSYTTLTPRQKLASVPYAIKAIAADTATVAQTANNSTSLGGITASSYLLNNGDGSQLLNVNGGFKWNVVTANQQAQSNNGYIANSSSEVAITLPTNPQIGDVVRVAGAGTGGWRISTNSGQTITPTVWTSRETNQNWQSIASSADGSKLVAVVNGGQIFTSTDSGVNWTARETIRSWTRVASSSDGMKLVASDTNGFLYTSTDSGINWVPRTGISGWGAVASSADGINLIALRGGSSYTSSDSGVTWIERPLPDLFWSVASSSDGTKLVAIVSGGRIYTSTDSGVSWTPRAFNNNWFSVASSADGTKLISAVPNGQIYTSADSGVSWTPRENNRGWLSVATSADGTRLVAVGSGTQIYISSDSGITWSVSEGNRVWQSVASSADGSKLAAVENGGKIYINSPIGLRNSFIELVYIGNGEFFVVNQK